MRFTIRDLLLLVCVVLLVPNTAAAQEAEYTAGGDAFGVTYSSYVFRDRLEKTPMWDGNAGNPPISARAALKAAEKETDIVRAPDTVERRLRQVALVPVRDRWLWEVSFVWKSKQGGSSGIPDYFDVLVLMDGSVIKPTPDGKRAR